ncbi:MAG: efflux RND transporter periplasmic adaptor subunit [Acidobacteriota bacterium]
MTGGPISLNRSAIVAGALGLLLLGAAGTLAWLRIGGNPTSSEPIVAEEHQNHVRDADSGLTSPQLAAVVVTLTRDAIERAGIVLATVRDGSDTSWFRVPGVVQPNEYRRVVVTPLVAGRVTRVLAELGQGVRRGQPLATIYSPELAEAHARVLTARAALEAHDRELQRTETLVGIGAASRQELERIHAEHTAQVVEVESARVRLELLGGPRVEAQNASAVAAILDVPAPVDGTIIERTANVGLNVDPSTPVFTVADLSTVWVVGDLYEQDFASVRLGTKAAVHIPAFPDLSLEGAIGYIDPQVSVATRTARVRVELPNPGARLRLGMYAELRLPASQPAGHAAGTPTVTIPKAAVQILGDRSVVYVVEAGDSGAFSEREVQLGQAAGDSVRVLSGVSAGESVVAEGSFFLRAEAERLGLRSATTLPGQRGGDMPIIPRTRR